MKAKRVLHGSVNVVGRLEETQRFYGEVLGLTTIPRPEIPGVGGQWFGVGDVEVHLVDAPAGDAGIRPADHHLCFAIDDLDAAIAELEEAGTPYLRSAQGEVVQIFITDPAGNVVELQQAR